MYDMTSQVPPMNFSDLFTAQNIGINPPPMSGVQSPWGGMTAGNTQPVAMPQSPQMPPEVNHLNDIIQQYTQNKQDQSKGNGFIQQILANRMQPTMDDASQSVSQTAQSFLAPNLFKPATPDEALAERYKNQLAPYGDALALGKTSAETSLENAQAGYYGSALQRSLAEKAFEYENDPQKQQARLMAQYMASLGGGGQVQPQQPMQTDGIPQVPTSSLNAPITPNQSIPNPPPSQNLPQQFQSNGQSGNVGFNPMGAMLAKSLGLTDMQIGSNGQPMPIPGAMKIEGGSVITIGPDGKPTSTIPQNPVARQSMEQTVNYLSEKLDELKKNGSAVDETQPWVENQFNAAMSNQYMQPLQSGNKAQTIRSEMASYVMSALPDYMQAKGITPGMERSLGGQELILKAIGIDPSNSIQANKEILRNISRVSGTGAFTRQSSIPTISSPNDPAFQQLPSGSQFMTPDGKSMVKH